MFQTNPNSLTDHKLSPATFKLGESKSKGMKGVGGLQQEKNIEKVQ